MRTILQWVVLLYTVFALFAFGCGGNGDNDDDAGSVSSAGSDGAEVDAGEDTEEEQGAGGTDNDGGPLDSSGSDGADVDAGKDAGEDAGKEDGADGSTDGTNEDGGSGTEDPVSVTLNGAVNKGPFVTGSTVNVSPVNDSGEPTGEVFTTQTINDLGEFSVNFKYKGYVSLQGQGFYYNEVIGELSGANITLRAFYEVTANGTQDAYINIVTHLTYNRVKNLISSGMDYPTAIAQAETELKDALAICPPGFDPGAVGTDMNISGGNTDANAYLLAVSMVIVQAASMRSGGSIDANLQELVNTYALDLESDGELNADKVDEIAAAKTASNPLEVMSMLEDRLRDVGSSADPPDIKRALAPECGDGIVSQDEQCDDRNDDDTDGCTTDCEYTCEKDADCTSSDASCSSNLTCDTDEHLCSGDWLPNETACEIISSGETGWCMKGVCVSVRCGNGEVEGAEECDDGDNNGEPDSDCTIDCKRVDH